MSTKRITIIGRGTAGCLSVLHFLRYTDWQIHWIFDERIKPQAVGEGSFPSLPRTLKECLNANYGTIKEFDGTIKLGIRKINWGSNGGDFYHWFPSPEVALHFNAIKFQNYVLTRSSELYPTRIKVENRAVINHDELDSDYIIDCSGRPETYTDFINSDYITVNSVYVTQCWWDQPEFDYTLTIARPHGWVFGIPLQNRCSVGYLYNNKFSTLEEVKQDVQTVFADWSLTPSDSTTAFSFENYYRKKNFTNRVAYNGNASFFLEPLEATSLRMMENVYRLAFDIIENQMDPEFANQIYLGNIKTIEHLIMLHYFAGSKFQTDFWQFAQNRGRKNLQWPNLEEDFRRGIIICSSLPENQLHTVENTVIGIWVPGSLLLNLQGLGIEEEILALSDTSNK